MDLGQILCYFLGKQGDEGKSPFPGDLYFGGETYKTPRNTERARSRRGRLSRALRRNVGEELRGEVEALSSGLPSWSEGRSAWLWVSGSWGLGRLM